MVADYFCSFRVPAKSTSKLQGVQVNDYQGQKLTSINSMPKTSIKGTQYINMSNYTLEVTGLVQNPRNYTYDEVLNHTAYQKVVTLNCVEGWDATILWQGVLVSDLLKDAKTIAIRYNGNIYCS